MAREFDIAHLGSEHRRARGPPRTHASIRRYAHDDGAKPAEHRGRICSRSAGRCRNPMGSFVDLLLPSFGNCAPPWRLMRVSSSFDGGTSRVRIDGGHNGARDERVRRRSRRTAAGQWPILTRIYNTAATKYILPIQTATSGRPIFSRVAQRSLGLRTCFSSLQTRMSRSFTTAASPTRVFPDQQNLKPDEYKIDAH